MFLVPEAEKLAFHQDQIPSGEGIFNPFLFHHAKPQKKADLPRNPFGFINPSPDQKKVLREVRHFIGLARMNGAGDRRQGGLSRSFRKHGKAGMLPRSILSGDHRQHFPTW
jgi:hypothetical protein